MLKNIFFLIVVIIIWMAFVYEGDETGNNPFPDFGNSSPQAEISMPDFGCAGKRTCAEMDSCEEAEFYMRNCPDTRLDPDGDGIPCENLCTGSGNR